MLRKSFVLSLISSCLLVSAGMAQEAATQEKTDKEQAKKLAGKLMSKWEGDSERMEKFLEERKEDFDQSAVDMAMERISEISIEFTKDGVFAVEFGGQEMSGEWSTTGAKKVKDKMVLEINTVTGEEFGSRELNFEIHFLGDSHIVMFNKEEADGSPPAVFKRVKKEKK